VAAVGMTVVMRGLIRVAKDIDDRSIALDNPLDQDESRVIETITSPRWQLFDLSHRPGETITLIIPCSSSSVYITR